VRRLRGGCSCGAALEGRGSATEPLDFTDGERLRLDSPLAALAEQDGVAALVGCACCQVAEPAESFPHLTFPCE
jgi:hypothetical protein